MSKKKSRRRVCMKISSQSMYHLENFARLYHKDIGWVVDKLTREKMISLHVERVPGGNHRRKDV